MTWHKRIGEKIGSGLRRGMVTISWFSVFHPRTVLILVALTTGISLYLAMDLKLSTNVEDLLPKDVPSAQRIRGLLTRYGGSEPVVVAISGDGENDIDDRIDLALAIRDGLRDNPNLRAVTGLFGEDPWSLLEGPQAEALMLYLEPQEIERLAAQLDRESIDHRVAADFEQLRSPLGPLTSRLIAEDPLGFAGFALRHLGALKGGLKISSREGVLVTEDAAYAVILLRPAIPAADIENARMVLREIQQVAQVALQEADLPGTVGVGPPPKDAPAGQIRIGLTGAPAILVDYRSMLLDDAKWVSVISYLAQLVLFVLAFRRIGALLVAGTSMLVGAIWALGFAELAIGEINIFTAGSIGILCGLTVDFTVHIYNRYLEEVHAGRDMARAFAIAMSETGLGILASVGVMVWSFIAAGMSAFRGLRDLGMICAAGLALSLIAALFMVPALTAVFVRVWPRPDRPRGLAGFGLEPVLTWVVRHPRWTIALSVLLALGLGIPAARMRLEEDFSKFRPQTAPSIRLQNDVALRTGTSLQPVLALVKGKTPEEILERSAKIEQAVDDLAREGQAGVAATLGPSRLIPAPSKQERALNTLRRLRTEGLIQPARVEADLVASMERHGFRIDDRVRHAAARVRKILERDRPLTLAEMRQGPLAEILDDLVITDTDGQPMGVVSAYPRPDARTISLIPALRNTLDRTGEKTELLGVRVLSQEIRPMILHDGTVATLVAIIGVMAILWFAFRRLSLVVMTTVPLLVGLVFSVGLMVLLHVDFNLVTVSMLPLIIGIAIDNGIHVVHRYLEGLESGTGTDMVDVFRHTGRGVVMASLTTIVGFGALLFADYPGLISSGVLAMLGTGATLVTAVTLLPALLVLLPVRR